MHILESCFQLPVSIYTILNSFINPKFFKEKTSQPPIKRLKLKLNTPFSKNDSFFEISRNSIQLNQISFKNSQSQAKHRLSLIEDPLWKLVCTEMADLMGPSSTQQMWDSKLGSYRFENNSIDLYCPTEETAHFISQYSFLVIGSLQRYFPTIKTLKTKVSTLFLFLLFLL